MSENVAIAQTDDDFDDEGSTAAKSDEKTFSQADIDRVVADRIARERAKYSDYADLKKKAKAAMSDQERAITEAEQRGRSVALQSAGSRLAKAELRAAAAGQVSPEALDGFLEYADLSRFVGEDGEPDSKAIAAAVKKLSGSAPSKTTNFDGGARSSADKPDDMNAQIRRLAGFA